MVKGVDVSEFQPGIDWQKVKAGTIQFAMLRAGYGKGNADAYFAENIAACEQVGMPVGITWMAYPLSAEDAAREAEYCDAAIKGHQITYPVAYDLEYDSVAYAKKCGVTLDKALATACARAFCECIKSAGYTPAVYVNSDYAARMLDLSQLPYDIWYAYYQPEPDRDDVSIWQYSDAGVVDGIKGSVDMDIAYKEYGCAEPETPASTTTSGGFDMSTLPVLGKGSNGRSVKAMQAMLNGYGYDCGSVDGIFGANTLSALESYQRDYGLDVDGYCGPLTWGSLLE